MSLGGSVFIEAQYNDGSKKYLAAHNKWSDYIMGRMIKNIGGAQGGTVPAGAVGDYVFPTQAILSEYQYEHASSSTIIAGSSLTTANYSSRSITTLSAASSPYSATDMNAGNYPCILFSNYMYGHYAVAGSSEVWDAEAFTVMTNHAQYTFLSAPITAGQTVISVHDDVSGWRDGTRISLRLQSYSESKRIVSTTTNTITVDSGFAYDHESGVPVGNYGATIYTAKATLTSTLNSGTNTANVDTTTGFAVSGNCMLMDGTYWEKIVIDSAGGGVITFSPNASRTYNAGSYIIQGFLSPHAASVQTISLNSGIVYAYADFTFSDTEGTAYGTNPIRTIGFKNSGNVTGWILLPEGIYKDSSTYLSTLRIYYYVIMAANI